MIVMDVILRMTRQLMNDKRAEDMTLAKATAYKKQFLEKQKRDMEKEIEMFKQISFTMDFFNQEGVKKEENKLNKNQ